MASASSSYQTIFKFILVGDASVGKSSLLHRYLTAEFAPASSHTIGVEFGSKIINIGGRGIKLQIWDTSGQERFRSVTRSYYRGAVGGCLVYDVTRRESFNNVQRWLADLRQLAEPDCSIVLVGNKVDLAESGDEREVSFMEAATFAQENNLLFLETSASTGVGVDDVFVKAANSCYTKQHEKGAFDEATGSSPSSGKGATNLLDSRVAAGDDAEGGCC